jgi:hypothetical protein
MAFYIGDEDPCTALFREFYPRVPYNNKIKQLHHESNSVSIHVSSKNSFKQQLESLITNLYDNHSPFDNEQKDLSLLQHTLKQYQLKSLNLVLDFRLSVWNVSI